MSANFKSVEEEINNSLNNMDGEDSSGSSSNAPEASADDTLNLTTEKFTIKYTKHTITKDFAGNPCIMAVSYTHLPLKTMEPECLRRHWNSSDMP